MAVLLSVLLSFGTTGAAAAHPFKDVIERYDAAVGYFYNAGVINGKNANEFGTYDPLKRGDAAVILSRALGLDADNAPDAGFQDVNSRIKGHVNALVQKGIIYGMNDTEFSPDTYLTRGQMAAILVRAFDLENYAKPTPFTDLSKTFKKDIEALYGAGITGGISATAYGTDKQIIRGDFVVLLYKTMKLVEENAVKSVKAVQPIHVPVGATLAELNLPQQVEVVYVDDTTGKKSVKWNTTGLDLTKPGENTIQGVVTDTPITATASIIVHGAEVDTLRDYTVAKGTNLSALQLPERVKLIYNGKMTAYRNVQWNTAGLDLNREGTYLLSGTIERFPGKATLKVIVEDIQVEALPDVIVAVGSKLSDVKLPAKVKLFYGDGTSEYKNVAWETESLNLNQAGTYEIVGSIVGTKWNTRMKVIVTDQLYPDSIQVNESQLTLLEGTSYQLIATLSPKDVANNKITWTSSNKEVAVVDSTGKVTAIAKGYAAIVAATANGKTATVNVTVVDDYIPELEVAAKASAIDKRIKSIEINIKNKGKSPVLLEKIEIYDNGQLDKTWTKDELEKDGIPVVIKANGTSNLSFGWRYGINVNNSYVKLYFNLNGKIYEYKRNL